MALTVEHEKERPVVSQNGNITIPVAVVIKDDAVEVKRQTVAEIGDKNSDLEIFSQAMIDKSQAVVDAYKLESQVFESGKFNTLISNMNSGVTI